MKIITKNFINIAIPPYSHGQIPKNYDENVLCTDLVLFH
jgi:hypothetical protein